MTTLFHFATPVNFDNFGLGIFPVATPSPTPSVVPGFHTTTGAYVPSATEEAWLRETVEQEDRDAYDAYLERMAWESIMTDRLCGQLTDYDVAVCGAVG